jgi:hypothetical protein
VWWLPQEAGQRPRAADLPREPAGERHGARLGVDQGEVAEVRVHPRLQARETGRLDARDHLGHALDGEPAELHLLARGDVGDVAPRLLRDLAEQPRLRGGDDAVFRDARALPAGSQELSTGDLHGCSLSPKKNGAGLREEAAPSPFVGRDRQGRPAP